MSLFKHWQWPPTYSIKESPSQPFQLTSLHPQFIPVLFNFPPQFLQGPKFLPNYLCLLGYLRSTSSAPQPQGCCSNSPSVMGQVLFHPPLWARLCRRKEQCWLCLCCSSQLTPETPHISPEAWSHLRVLTCLLMASKGAHLKLAWVSINCFISRSADMPNPQQHEIIDQTLVIVLLWEAGCF